MQQRSGAVHDCAIKACGALIPMEMLMCKKHWFSVPETLRGEVWDTWRRLKRDRGIENLKAYKEARRKAVAAVKAA
jgi:hypothetical protein